jgi:hypothetical protein
MLDWSDELSHYIWHKPLPELTPINENKASNCNTHICDHIWNYLVEKCVVLKYKLSKRSKHRKYRYSLVKSMSDLKQ